MTTIEGTKTPDLVAADIIARLCTALPSAGLAPPADVLWGSRYLFAVIAEDAGLLPKRIVRDILEHIHADGSDVGSQFRMLFDTLGTPPGERHPNLARRLAGLPYLPVWFPAPIPEPVFSPEMLRELIAVAEFDWSILDPMILGAVFQTVADPDARRRLGSNYTAEQTIRKVLDELRLDDLRMELVAAARDEGRLLQLHDRLAGLEVLDPAAGCGDFLAVAYREARRIEMEVYHQLIEIDPVKWKPYAANNPAAVRVRPGNFHGIEVDPFPRAISEITMAMAIHRMNVEFARAFDRTAGLAVSGQSADLRLGDALELDWAAVAPPGDNLIICGNPPFAGSQQPMAPAQAAAREKIWAGIKGAGNLDFVSCWFLLASNLIAGTKAKAAFIATSSLVQGSQVDPFWRPLSARGMKIDFAWRPFEWINHAPGESNVHVVAFGIYDGNVPNPGVRRPRLHSSRMVHGSPEPAAHPEVINGYLIAAPDVIIRRAPKPISRHLSALRSGVDFSDGSEGKELGMKNAGLIMDEEGCEEVALDRYARKYLRQFMGGQEMVKGIKRGCLWLVDADPWDLEIPVIKRRLDNVEAARSMMKSEEAKLAASTPWMPMRGFYEGPMDDEILLIPNAGTGKDRKYLPAMFVPRRVVPSSTVNVAYRGTLLDFAVASSRHFRLWLDTVGGRLKSDARVNISLVWNTFLLPNLGDGKIDTLQAAARGVLDARDPVPLKDLYDDGFMSAKLLAAHERLDAEMDVVFGLTGPDDTARLAVLFDRYEKLMVDPQLF